MSCRNFLMIFCFLSIVCSGVVQSETYYFHNNQLGAPEVLTDSDQNVVWKASYDPSGQANISTAVVEQNIRLPGQYFDSETGNHYNYFRDYSPSTGRYVQSDPVGLLGGAATYVYAAANPISAIDPLGLSALTIWYTDGRTVKTDNPTGRNLVDQLSQSASGSISQIAISGHGNNWTQCISPQESRGSECSEYIDSRLDIRVNFEKAANIRDLLLDKIVPGGLVDLAGCKNASEETNIVRSISSLLTGLHVQGGVSNQLGYENHRWFGNSSRTLGIKAVYLNGKKL